MTVYVAVLTSLKTKGYLLHKIKTRKTKFNLTGQTWAQDSFLCTTVVNYDTVLSFGDLIASHMMWTIFYPTHTHLNRPFFANSRFSGPNLFLKSHSFFSTNHLWPTARRSWTVDFLPYLLLATWLYWKATIISKTRASLNNSLLLTDLQSESF